MIGESLWVRKAAKGDREAFGRLVKKYRGPLFSFLLRYIGDEEEAADILQDAFLRAWEKLQGFRS
ncbi:MAG: RNA polymerase subunit sigma-24, partial [Deltaproteobacteria bacterium]